MSMFHIRARASILFTFFLSTGAALGGTLLTQASFLDTYTTGTSLATVPAYSYSFTPNIVGTGGGTAVAEFLSLGTRASMSAFSDSGQLPGDYRALARAESDVDMVVKGGPTNSTGFLRMNFNLSGYTIATIESTDPGARFLVEVSSGLYFTGWSNGGRGASTSWILPVFSPNTGTYTTVPYSVLFPVVFGGKTHLHATMSSIAGLKPTGYLSGWKYKNFSGQTNYLNTFLTTAVDVLDGNRNPIPNFNIQTDSNIIYPTSASAAAPEPFLLGLAGLSLWPAVLLGRRLRCKRHTPLPGGTAYDGRRWAALNLITAGRA